MDTTEGAPAAAAGISLADHEAAVAKARTEGTADGIKAAATRIKTILGSEEAKGRADMAQHLAFESDMSAEASVALLAKSPKGANSDAPSIEQRQNDALALGGSAPAPKTVSASWDKAIARLPGARKSA